MTTDPPEDRKPQADPSVVATQIFDSVESGREPPPHNGSESEGGGLPTFEAPAKAPIVRGQPDPLASLAPGQRLAQFELIRELGAGSFGRVFLARHLPLDRLVALKVTAQHSGEARALARLEHDHIVRVFAEELDAASGLRLLSMQYVPGTTLTKVMETLAEMPAPSRSGRAMIRAVAVLSAERPPAEESIGRESWPLAHCDRVEAVCWLGARLAEALDHAHHQGVLHRDVKPSNILLHVNGRVLLTDFNLAADPRPGEIQIFGGTPAYMAPEHLDAFHTDDPAARAAVDARSDVYSLGVVLFELITGQRPFRTASAEERREMAPSPRQLVPDLPPVLDRVVRRCLDPDPRNRYASAGELARVLDGCRELVALSRAVPAGPLTRATRKRPLLVASTLPLIPHLVGALVVFGYTLVWVSSHPHRAILQGHYAQMTMWYSLLVFPITGGIAYALTRPIWRVYLLLMSTTPVHPDEVLRARRRALRKPFLGMLLSGAGWLPGAIVLPLLVWMMAPDVVTWEVLSHYCFAFVIAGLIALTYTEFVDQFLLLCVAYPALWIDPVRPREVARVELEPVERRLRVSQVLSVMVPLATGIVLMAGLVSAGPEQRASSGYRAFLIVVAGLIGLGLTGSWLAVLMSGRLSRAAAALTRTGEGDASEAP